MAPRELWTILMTTLTTALICWSQKMVKSSAAVSCLKQILCRVSFGAYYFFCYLLRNVCEYAFPIRLNCSSKDLAHLSQIINIADAAQLATGVATLCALAGLALVTCRIRS